MKEQRTLWKRAFQDSEKYMDYYFANKAGKSCVYTDWEGEELCAMAFFTPYSAFYMGHACKIPYIVGVATEEKYRRQKRMTRLLERGINEWREKSPLVFLSPETPRVYEPLGFVGTYRRETTRIHMSGKRWFPSQKWHKLSEKEKEEVVQFVGNLLAEEAFELYLDHSKEYYEEVEKEMQALDGGILVLREETAVIAVVNYIHEDAEYEVTELICHRKQSRRVIESILDRLDTSVLVVDDSYFISGLENAEISKEPQEKPYIMYRVTSEDKSPILRCYINDIT